MHNIKVEGKMIVELKRLNLIFSRLRNLPIAVLGDVMLDRYIWGNAERISPEAPVPVVFVEGETTRLGGAANVAWNIRAIGAKPLLFGVVGEDRFAAQLKDLMSEYDISSEYLVVDAGRPTTSKTRIIARGQQVVRIDRENIIDVERSVENRLVKSLLETLDDVAGIVISDYGKGVISRGVLRKVISAARERKKFVAVDPKERHFSLYKGVSIITPNKKEAGEAVGIKIRDEKSLLRVGRKLMKKTGAENILITRGSEGMSLFYGDGEVEHFPTMARQVYDVTGAGDTVVSVFTATLSAGGTLREGAIISSHAASVVIGKLGTAVASPKEIITSIKQEISRRRNSK
ncbi:D-glycero-beta-D-manno-heptose-7-phosphate kinase [bacterium]|nr:MAG: D-glycero-beta-D-manno-heptose-7-phosphate kinase [bacterium]